MKAEPTYFPTAPLAPSPPETDMERLERYTRTLDYHESKSGKHNGIQAAWYRRELRKMARKMGEGD